DGAEEAIFTIPFCYTYVTKNNLQQSMSRGSSFPSCHYRGLLVPSGGNKKGDAYENESGSA
ncbi:hypothetical protein, partial [Salmonella enterica]|uniref:hypothetical protein n=1 Tax=Salmonella enterica TaxID=28901 RepID=UPI0019554489